MIYYSTKTRSALADITGELPPGAAHYSYSFVCRKFLELFEYEDISAQELLRPEIYPHSSFLSHAPSRPIHFIVKPFEEIRLLKGARNIAEIMWEFEELPDFRRLPTGHPARVSKMNDYAHMLGLCDEIWVGCSFSKTVLENSGIQNVHVVPAPVRKRPNYPRSDMTKRQNLERLAAVCTTPLSRPPQGQSEAPLVLGDALLASGGCLENIFLAIINPGDMRKNLPALIRGFSVFSADCPSAVLLIKFIIDNNAVQLQNVFDGLLPMRFFELEMEFAATPRSNIFAINKFLTDEELQSLYKLSDFYISTSFAEGQNLPLLEAMAAGTIPVSPATTAMADYIDDGNAVVLETIRVPLFHHAAAAYNLTNCSWEQVPVTAIKRGLTRAVEMPKEERHRKSSSAREAVERFCGFNRVSRIVRSRLFAGQISPS